jgi:hypothetical protein
LKLEKCIVVNVQNDNQCLRKSISNAFVTEKENGSVKKKTQQFFVGGGPLGLLGS